MTSSNPLETLALTALKQAAESGRPLSPAQQYDLAHARALTPGQRLELMNQILLRAEAFGKPKPDLGPHRYRTMLL